MTKDNTLYIYLRLPWMRHNSELVSYLPLLRGRTVIASIFKGGKTEAQYMKTFIWRSTAGDAPVLSFVPHPLADSGKMQPVALVITASVAPHSLLFSWPWNNINRLSSNLVLLSLPLEYWVQVCVTMPGQLTFELLLHAELCNSSGLLAFSCI